MSKSFDVAQADVYWHLSIVSVAAAASKACCRKLTSFQLLNAALIGRRYGSHLDDHNSLHGVLARWRSGLASFSGRTNSAVKSLSFVWGGGGSSARLSGKGLPNSARAGFGRGQLVKAEGRGLGGVSWSVYVQYCQQVGGFVTLMLVLLLLGGQAAYIASDWWLAMWAYSAPADQSDPK